MAYDRQCRHCGVRFSAARPETLYCSPAHRTAAYRRRRQGLAEASHSRHARSGLQVSYRKAVKAVAFHLVTTRDYVAGPGGSRHDQAHTEATRILRAVLSPAQRARLEARS